VLAAVTARLARARAVASRATPAPLIVRCVVAVCGVLAVAVAYPRQVLGTQYAVALFVLAVLPAFLPRGRAATTVALAVVAGWVLDTTYFDQPVVLWRVLALATLLYLSHTLTALAAALPTDAVVRPAVVAHWLARAAAVVLVSAVLTVVVLALTAELAGAPFIAATVVGLAAAVAVAVLLSRLLRRP
jgi:hypothetical protein